MLASWVEMDEIVWNQFEDRYSIFKIPLKTQSSNFLLTIFHRFSSASFQVFPVSSHHQLHSLTFSLLPFSLRYTILCLFPNPLLKPKILTQISRFSVTINQLTGKKRPSQMSLIQLYNLEKWREAKTNKSLKAEQIYHSFVNASDKRGRGASADDVGILHKLLSAESFRRCLPTTPAWQNCVNTRRLWKHKNLLSSDDERDAKE
jgi:hypothetical protein